MEIPQLKAEVLPEWIDANGHMNLAYYVVLFDQATDLLYDALDIGQAYRDATGNSTFTAETHTLYEREVRVGERVRVVPHLLGADAKRLHYFHEMFHARIRASCRGAGVDCAAYRHVVATRRAVSGGCGRKAPAGAAGTGGSAAAARRRAANCHAGLTHEHGHCCAFASAHRGARACLRAALLGLRRSCRGGRAAGDPVSLGVHHLHVAARLEGHRRNAIRRPRQLRQDVTGRAVLVGHRPHGLVHGRHRHRPDAAWRLGGGLLRVAVQAARPRADAVCAADDGDAGGDRAGVDDDVPPAAWRAQLPADVGRTAAVKLGL